MKLIPYKKIDEMLSAEEVWQCVQFDFPLKYKDKVLKLCNFYEQSIINFQDEKDIHIENLLEIRYGEGYKDCKNEIENKLDYVLDSLADIKNSIPRLEKDIKELLHD